MLFNSLQFLVFFPIVFIVYYLSPCKYRWAVLLAASAYFYLQFQPVFAIILTILIAAVYTCGLLIAKSTSRAQRRFFLIASLILASAPLLVFKYANFFNDSIHAAFMSTGVKYTASPLRLLLPVGISFFTFKLLSYLIDVYRGTLKPEYHPGKFALHISFFPQILAGPIERASHFLPQLNIRTIFSDENITGGLKLMLWGLFKKAVIADPLALLVNRVYDTPADYSGVPLIIATYLFSFQIFCDFSGYSDMAIGAARVLGFSTMDNFRRPYFSKTISEFWRRWHMTLSFWFRDYLYIPLGGNRTSILVWCRNILIVFIISGLWHGANWTFFIWGGLHGTYLIAGRFTAKLRDRFWNAVSFANTTYIRKFIMMFSTFHLVTFAWIFFRAKTVTDAFHIVGSLFSGWSLDLSVYNGLELAGAAGLIAIMEIVHLMQRTSSIIYQLNRMPVMIRWGIYAILILCIINLRPEYQAPFIYMKF